MIVIGTTNLTMKRGTGSFYCPTCSAQSPYTRKLVRQFLTIYFIPLIPLNKVREYLECGTCRGEFSPEAADLDAHSVQEAQRAAAYELMRRILVLIVGADAIVTEDELAVVRQFTQQFLQEDVSVPELLGELDRVRDSGIEIESFILHLAEQLPDEYRELLIRYAFLAASAEGSLSASRADLLMSMPALLGVTEAQFRRVVEQSAEDGL